VLEILNVTKRFHTLVAVDNLTLKVPRGEVLGVLGPNGAGKTTLFRLIAGFLKPDHGYIRTTTGVWPTIGYKAERLLFPNHLRVREYLNMVASISNLPKPKIKIAISESLERVDLAYAADKRIKECSKGMRQRLGLAQAMIGDPQILLLDEPSNGLDPEGQAEICYQIQKLNQDGKTIILASHQLQEVTQVCTYLVIMNQGSIHYQNQMKAALAERPHTKIVVNKDLSPLEKLLIKLHPDIELFDKEIVLNFDAIALRPNVLRILLSNGYDIVRIEQSRVTLAEIYAAAVQ
jgi:ABC-2 type transport system ATP-binding protein